MSYFRCYEIVDAILRGVCSMSLVKRFNRGRGFCQDFYKKIRSVCDVAKSLDFQGRRYLIFLIKLV